MKNLILIKLGGSVITDKDKPFVVRLSVISRLAGEINKAKSKLKNTDFIIGHGSGSFGHTVAAKYQVQKGNINKDSTRGFCLTSEAAVDINRIVLKELLRVDLPVVSFSPLSFSYKNTIFLKPLEMALELGFVPLVYGDILFDAVSGFKIHSAEKTLTLLAWQLFKKYGKVKIIEAGDTGGVYDGKGKTIPEINLRNFAGIKKWVLGSRKTDVTGGMLHKVRESLALAKKYRIPTVIINGNKKGNLIKAILGKKVISTRITD